MGVAIPSLIGKISTYESKRLRVIYNSGVAIPSLIGKISTSNTKSTVQSASGRNSLINRENFHDLDSTLNDLIFSRNSLINRENFHLAVKLQRSTAGIVAIPSLIGKISTVQTSSLSSSGIMCRNSLINRENFHHRDEGSLLKGDDWSRNSLINRENFHLDNYSISIDNLKPEVAIPSLIGKISTKSCCCHCGYGDRHGGRNSLINRENFHCLAFTDIFWEKKVAIPSLIGKISTAPLKVLI